jgi:hypothetical protein
VHDHLENQNSGRERIDPDRIDNNLQTRSLYIPTLARRLITMADADNETPSWLSNDAPQANTLDATTPAATPAPAPAPAAAAPTAEASLGPNGMTADEAFAGKKYVSSFVLYIVQHFWCAHKQHFANGRDLALAPLLLSMPSAPRLTFIHLVRSTPYQWISRPRRRTQKNSTYY